TSRTHNETTLSCLLCDFLYCHYHKALIVEVTSCLLLRNRSLHESAIHQFKLT
ncbi:unnamed protein product, partial [Tenebrio molitor]